MHGLGLWCLVLSVVLVTSSAEKYTKNLDYFEAVFGKNTYLYDDTLSNRHELFDISHQKQAERILSMNKDEKPGHFLGCAEYERAVMARDSLKKEFGDINVHMILSQKSTSMDEGLACFLVEPSRITPSLLDAKSFLNVWLPLPSSLKLSSGAHDQLESLLAAQKSGLSPSNVMNQLATVELEIQLGKSSSKKGSIGGERRVKSESIASSIRKSLSDQSSDNAMRTKNIADISSMIPHTNGWKVAASQINVEDIGKRIRRLLTNAGASSEGVCNFDDLIFQSHDEFLFITHMHKLADPSCFASVLSTAAHAPDVVSIFPSKNYRPLLDFVGDLLHSGDASEGRVYHDVGLTGSSVVVGLLDGGVDEYSCFFNNSDGDLCPRSLQTSPTHDNTRRKVIQYSYAAGGDSIEANENGHGTGMAGIICGESSGGAHTNHFGVAPGAKIAFFDASTSSANIGPLNDNLDTYFDVATTTGAKLYSASWGNRYDAYVARDVVNDQYAVDNDFLLIAAVGNYVNVIYNKVFSPAMSKNALTVGASGTSGETDPNSLAWFSCTGPTYDNRFGVDVLAHGVDVYAPKSAGYTDDETENTCELASRTGTSSATAAVAGVAALVQEYFQNASFWAAHCNQDYAFCSAGATNPKTILIKNMIIHSGQDVGNSLAYPGHEQGFGRVQLDSVLLHPGVTTSGLDLYIEEVVLEEEDSFDWVLTVTSNTLPLKVTIAWVDPANVVSASKQLLNDIDLRVTDEGGSVTYGNNNATGDSCNNVEMVYIASPSPGKYTITISTATLGSGSSQSVSMVATSYGSVTRTPEMVPTGEPSPVPIGAPTVSPSSEPSGKPSSIPSSAPSSTPSSEPTHQPNYNRPSKRPVFTYIAPTRSPTVSPTPAPTTPAVVEPPTNRAPTPKPTFTL